MDNTGKVLIALGLAGLTGAAIQASVDNRNREEERREKTQQKLVDKIQDQDREIDRLRREQNRLVEKLEAGN